MNHYRVLAGLTAALATVTAPGAGSPAAAEPSTTVNYPVSASATWFTGDAFDACDAPTTTSMNAWRASPFRAAVARWDGVGSPSFVGIPSSQWANHQRGKQYRGDHDERWGGVTINVDSNYFDAPVATVAHPYRSTTSVNARSGPSTSSPVVTTHASGATLRVVCQTPGTTVGSTPVWNRFTDGSYATDYYMATPSKTTYSKPIPRC